MYIVGKEWRETIHSLKPQHYYIIVTEPIANIIFDAQNRFFVVEDNQHQAILQRFGME